MRRAVSIGLLCGIAQLSSTAQVTAQESALSDELHPSWSPNGTQLVFQSDRGGSADLYVFDLASGESRRLTDLESDEESPVWSPDGRWIAFHSDREGHHDLYVIRPDGSELRRLTSGANDETDAAWSPSSREIAYSERTGPRTWLLRLLDTESLATRSLVDRDGSSLTPAWILPRRIAYTYSPPRGNHDTEIALHVVTIEGVELGELLAAGHRGDSNVQYSAAAGRLVFNSIRDGNWEIYTSRLDGGGEERLTTQAGPGTTGIDGQPDWSPRGDRIAITSGRAGSLDIVILRPDGSEERNLTRSWIHDDR